MGPFYKNLFGSLPQKFFLLGDGNLLDHFLVFLDDHGLISVLDDFNNLYFRHSYLNGYFPVESNDLSVLYNVRDFLLYLDILGLFDNLRDPHLHLFNLLSGLIQVHGLLDYLLNLDVLSSPSLNDLLDLLELHLLHQLLHFDLPHHLLTLIQPHWFLVHHWHLHWRLHCPLGQQLPNHLHWYCLLGLYDYWYILFNHMIDRLLNIHRNFFVNSDDGRLLLSKHYLWFNVDGDTLFKGLGFIDGPVDDHGHLYDFRNRPKQRDIIFSVESINNVIFH